MGKPARKRNNLNTSGHHRKEAVRTGQFPHKGNDLKVDVGAMLDSLKDICSRRAC